ncbi:hypothetical protein Enr13x_30090 [Stieleria neptunia]|uniref:Methyltransferase FkbM domain-containing protein n=1 Tax=Stieleria neptunia TaxID=2527979 RepID=A0A518HQM5_9BACT|nr:FkbM family methyltransferase [Stieleria neptunia]QDV43155.1 hypothetical protein Enr13x_30090 [Stieleria neptunia]
MSLKSLIQSCLSPLGVEIRRVADPTLPLLHQFTLDGKQRRFWLTNPFTKSWWHKPEIQMNGELSELKRLCTPSSRVLEIGAHHGLMTILMADCVGTDGHVFAVEASADNAFVLDANCFQNRLSNVSTWFTAIGRTAGTARFGGESLAASSGIVREVPMVTADQFCDSNAGDRIDVLKIDVEGFEMEVLQGAAHLLQQRPKLALELHVDLLVDAGSSAKEVWDLLETSGMFQDRKTTMLTRPNWNDIRPVNDFNDLPTSGVVNLFVS